MERSSVSFPHEARDGAWLSERMAARGVALRLYPTVDSTSSEARRLAGSVAAPACFLADAQTGGRGRLGRSFFSPPHTGLYLSLLLRREGTENETLTAAAAVAARRAIRRVCGVTVQIKWVNDLYLGERKVAGILCEAFAANDCRFAIVGLGVNLSTSCFPDELQAKAGALSVDASLRYALADAFTDELFSLLAQWKDRSFMAEYRDAALTTGRRVRFTENGILAVGTALPPDDDGALPIRLEDGRIHRLVGGEITVIIENHGQPKKDEK